MTGIIAVIMVFSIPIVAIITDYMKSITKQKAKMLHVELELEKVKHENFVLETEKMRLELEKMRLDYTKTEDPVILALQKEKANIM